MPRKLPAGTQRSHPKVVRRQPRTQTPLNDPTECHPNQMKCLKQLYHPAHPQDFTPPAGLHTAGTDLHNS